MQHQYKYSGLLCLFACAGLQACFAAGSGPDWSNLVVVGDSLSAGVQNFSLYDVQQPNGYASLLANQVGTTLTLPLVSFPGIPNVLELDSLGPPPVIAPDPSTATPIRDNPTALNNNVSVPGVTVNQALTLRPAVPPTSAVQAFADYVLGYTGDNPPPTEIELATQLRPTTVIEWLGNNDALVPALIGQLNTLTPILSFAIDYNTVLDKLAATGSRIITANIPDVTEIAFFMTADEIATQYGLPVDQVREMLGIKPGDLVRITAAEYVYAILTGQPQAVGHPLPAACPSPQPGLASSVPCVLTADQAFQVRSAVSCYNLIIAAESFAHGALMVDIKNLVDNLYQNGYSINEETLNLDFLGGIASLDGIHPTNTAYAIIANKFIDTINEVWKTKIREVNVGAIAAKDPLIFPQVISHQNPQHPLPTPGACLTDLAAAVPK